MVRLRLAEPPPDGGLWSSRKVADVMATHLGLERVLPQRGWEALKALGWSLQRPAAQEPEVRHKVENLVAHFLLGDQLVLHVYGELNVVADADLGHGRHGPGIRIGERDLVRPGALQLGEHLFVAVPFAPDRGDLLGQLTVASARMVADGALLTGITLVKPSHVGRQLLIGFPGRRWPTMIA